MQLRILLNVYKPLGQSMDGWFGTNDLCHRQRRAIVEIQPLHEIQPFVEIQLYPPPDWEKNSIR